MITTIRCPKETGTIKTLRMFVFKNWAHNIITIPSTVNEIVSVIDPDNQRHYVVIMSLVIKCYWK